MERYPISVLGAFILVQPLVGPLYGWLLRGEVLSWRSAAGGALVIGGIALTSLWQPKTRWA
jgi:drug/metabolite transporter (DMT)-like permease